MLGLCEEERPVPDGKRHDEAHPVEGEGVGLCVAGGGPELWVSVVVGQLLNTLGVSNPF